jgi:hypothetical protein
LEDHFVHANGLPTSGIEGPSDVVSENVDLAVVGEQFVDESMGVLDETFARIFIWGAQCAVRMMLLLPLAVDCEPKDRRFVHLGASTDLPAADPRYHQGSGMVETEGKRQCGSLNYSGGFPLGRIVANIDTCLFFVHWNQSLW